MLAKRTFICAAVAGLVLAAGCGQSKFDQKREEARQRWGRSRAEMAVNLAQGSFDRGEFKRARRYVNEILEHGEPNAGIHILAARLDMVEKDFDKARRQAETAKVVDPTSAEACYVLGTVEQILSHKDRALEEFSQAVELDPGQPRYVLAEAELLVAAGRRDEAAEYLSSAVDLMPGRAEIHAALADVLALLGRHEQAVGSYRIALRLEPDQNTLKERMAMALFRSGAYADTETVLADLMPDDAKATPVWMVRMRGDCLLALGRTDEARDLYQQRAQALPESPGPLVALAKCDIVDNRLPSARGMLEQALTRRPQDTEANALMGYVLVAQGRSGEAVSHLKLALKDPKCEGRNTVEALLARAEARAEAPAGG